MGILDRLNREDGITIILVTHEADIAGYASREIIIKDGQIVQDLRRAPHLTVVN
jgi:ABC-type lipoprotein export system ATPase subunit